MNWIDMENISRNCEFRVVLFDGLQDWNQSFHWNWLLCFVCALAFQTIHTGTQNVGCNGNISSSKWTVSNSPFGSQCHQSCITWMTCDVLKTPHNASCRCISFGEFLLIAWNGRNGVYNMDHVLSCKD